MRTRTALILGAVVLVGVAGVGGAVTALDDDPGQDLSGYGTHVLVYEQWYDRPTRGDLADDDELVERALDRAREVIERIAGRSYINGEVVGEPRAAFAVDTRFGALVYVTGHVESHYEGEGYIASDVPLPLGVVVRFDDDGAIHSVIPETPVSQAESGTNVSHHPVAIGALADPAGRELVVFDTGYPTRLQTGVVQSDDPDTGPIAVGTRWRSLDLSDDGVAVVDASGTLPFSADLEPHGAFGTVIAGQPYGLEPYFGGLLACCAERALDGGPEPLSRAEARALLRRAVGDRMDQEHFAAFPGTDIFQARLLGGGVALLRTGYASPILGARLGDGGLVASRCVLPESVRAFVCHVPQTGTWIVGTDLRPLEVRPSVGAPWQPSVERLGSPFAVVSGSAPEMRIRTRDGWVVIDLERVHADG